MPQPGDDHVTGMCHVTGMIVMPGRSRQEPAQLGCVLVMCVCPDLCVSLPAPSGVAAGNFPAQRHNDLATAGVCRYSERPERMMRSHLYDGNSDGEASQQLERNETHVTGPLALDPTCGTSCVCRYSERLKRMVRSHLYDDNSESEASNLAAGKRAQQEVVKRRARWV